MDINTPSPVAEGDGNHSNSHLDRIYLGLTIGLPSAFALIVIIALFVQLCRRCKRRKNLRLQNTQKLQTSQSNDKNRINIFPSPDEFPNLSDDADGVDRQRTKYEDYTPQPQPTTVYLNYPAAPKDLQLTHVIKCRGEDTGRHDATDVNFLANNGESALLERNNLTKASYFDQPALRTYTNASNVYVIGDAACPGTTKNCKPVSDMYQDISSNYLNANGRTGEGMAVSIVECASKERDGLYINDAANNTAASAPQLHEPELYKALYAYTAIHEGDLQLEEGDTVEVLEKVETGWWRGNVGPRQGWFPGSYVEPLSRSSHYGFTILTPPDGALATKVRYSHIAVMSSTPDFNLSPPRTSSQNADDQVPSSTFKKQQSKQLIAKQKLDAATLAKKASILRASPPKPPVRNSGLSSKSPSKISSENSFVDSLRRKVSRCHSMASQTLSKETIVVAGAKNIKTTKLTTNNLADQTKQKNGNLNSAEAKSNEDASSSSQEQNVNFKLNSILRNFDEALASDTTDSNLVPPPQQFSNLPVFEVNVPSRDLSFENDITVLHKNSESANNCDLIPTPPPLPAIPFENTLSTNDINCKVIYENVQRNLHYDEQSTNFIHSDKLAKSCTLREVQKNKKLESRAKSSYPNINMDDKELDLRNLLSCYRMQDKKQPTEEQNVAQTNNSDNYKPDILVSNKLTKTVDCQETKLQSTVISHHEVLQSEIRRNERTLKTKSEGTFKIENRNEIFAECIETRADRKQFMAEVGFPVSTTFDKNRRLNAKSLEYSETMDRPRFKNVVFLQLTTKEESLA